MKMTARLSALFCLMSAWSLAATWRAVLVDYRCWESEEHNVNPTDSLTAVDRDRAWEIRFCAPKAKTKSFAIVLPGGESLELSATGNQKAAEFVRKTGKQSVYPVQITGEQSGRRLSVETISLAE